MNSTENLIKEIVLKKRYILAAASLLTMLGANCIEHDHIYSPTNETIIASGDLVLEDRNLDFFNSVIIVSAGKVYITQGGKQSVEVIVDDNILEHVTTKVINERLEIGIRSGKSVNYMNLTVNITMTDLEELMTAGAGNIEEKNKFYVNDVKFYLSSAGNITLDIEADKIESYLSSAGSLILTGKATDHIAVISSAGSLYAFGLVTENAVITVNSAGNANVYVTKYLSAIITSIGSLYYKGYPQIDQSTTSLGRLIDVN